MHMRHKKWNSSNRTQGTMVVVSLVVVQERAELLGSVDPTCIGNGLGEVSRLLTIGAFDCRKTKKVLANGSNVVVKEEESMIEIVSWLNA